MDDPGNGQGPTHIDLEALGLAHLAKGARTATFAPNWKSVIAADGFVGLVIVALGLLVSLWISWLGWIVIGLGIVYVALVVRRFLQWRWLRGQAGLA